MANAVRDRIGRLEDRINGCIIKSEIIKHGLKKSGQFEEGKHPRADDGKFGSGSTAPKETGASKTTFSPVSHAMAKTILSRSNKERSKDIDTLAKMPKKELKEKSARIQSQIDDAREEQKKDPENQKWKDVGEALSRMHGDVTAAMS